MQKQNGFFSVAAWKWTLLLTNKNGGFVNNFVNTCAGFVVYNKNALFMAKMKVTPRRLILEDKVYRQILHAEVIFQLFFRPF